MLLVMSGENSSLEEGTEIRNKKLNVSKALSLLLGSPSFSIERDQRKQQYVLIKLEPC